MNVIQLFFSNCNKIIPSKIEVMCVHTKETCYGPDHILIINLKLIPLIENNNTAQMAVNDYKSLFIPQLSYPQYLLTIDKSWQHIYLKVVII